MQETQVWSLGQEDTLEDKWQPAPVFLPGKSHGQRSLVGYRPWGRKESDRLTDIVNDNNNKGTNKDQQIYQGEKNMNELDQDTQEKINPRGNR